jgi:hypothetical protein
MDEFALLAKDFEHETGLAPEALQRVRWRVQQALSDDDSPMPLIVREAPNRKAMRVRALTIAAALAACVVLVGVGVSTFNPGRQPTHSETLSWKLAGYFNQPSITEDEAGPNPGLLSCETDTTCFVVSQATGESPATLFVTTDFGQTWSTRSMPAGATTNTPLQCVTDTCYVGATISGSGAMLVTTDDGQSWRSVPLPVSDGSLYELTCQAQETCEGLASTNHSLSDDMYLTTNNGGMSWRSYVFPSSEIETSIACPTAQDCVVTGKVDLVEGRAATWVTHDGGKFWAKGGSPSNASFGSWGISCSDAGACLTVADVPVTLPRCSISELSSGALAGNSANQTICTPIGGTVLKSEPVVSTDWGMTWTLRTFPSQLPMPAVLSLSCEAAQVCWAAGFTDVPNQTSANSLPVGSGSSPVILMTHDGGLSWTYTIPPTPTSVIFGETTSGLSQIACPTSASCLATGIDNGDSPNTIVYRYG